MRLLVSLPLIALLGACAATLPPEPVVVTKIVEVPVARSCVPAGLSAAPNYVDTDAALRAAPDAAARLMLLFAGRLQRIARGGETEPVIQNCRD